MKWLSSVPDSSHFFKGCVVKVIGDRAIVDDGSNLTLRVIPVHRLLPIK